MNVDLGTLFAPLEQALDNHSRLSPSQARPIHLRIDRDGCGVYAFVKLRGSRKVRYDEIHAFGETPEEAVSKLAGGLDFWAEALR